MKFGFSKLRRTKAVIHSATVRSSFVFALISTIDRVFVSNMYYNVGRPRNEAKKWEEIKKDEPG